MSQKKVTSEDGEVLPFNAKISDHLFATAKDNKNWPAYMTNGLDFASVRPSQVGRYYDEVFTGGEDSFLVGRIYKSKYSTLERWVWHEVGYHCAQTAVSERPENFSADENESDIVVMAVCTPYSDSTGKPFFLVLDGDMQELARAYLPDGVKVPATLHTTFISRTTSNSNDDDDDVNDSSVSLSLSLLPNAPEQHDSDDDANMVSEQEANAEDDDSFVQVARKAKKNPGFDGFGAPDPFNRNDDDEVDQGEPNAPEEHDSEDDANMVSEQEANAEDDDSFMQVARKATKKNPGFDGFGAPDPFNRND